MKFECEVEIEDQDRNLTTNGIIKYEVDFECRSWGVKSIYITIPDQKIYVGWESEDENGDPKNWDGYIEVKDCKYELDLHEKGEVICPEILVFTKDNFLLQF